MAGVDVGLGKASPTYGLFYTRILNKYMRLECCYLRFKMRRLDERCVKLLLKVKASRDWHVQYPSGSGEVLTRL